MQISFRPLHPILVPDKEENAIATYVIADIHGEYDKFIELLDRIRLQDEDTLYILGDVLDRGPHPIKVVLKLMEMPNAFLIAGNHELMALSCLDTLRKEITEASVAEIDDEFVARLMNWQMNGSQTTLDEFDALDPEMQEEVVEYLQDALLYEELSVSGRDYLLVHAGLGNFSPEKPLDDYTVDELVWERPDYSRAYYPDKYVVTGHTPTAHIRENPRPYYIYRSNNHIAIDCGACFPDGRLAAICLDTDEEYYV